MSGEIELRQLTRLRGILHSDRGRIQANLKFYRQTNLSVTVDLSFETVLELICQRCLEPLEHNVHEQVSLTLIEPESVRKEVAKEHEAVIVVDDKLNPAALIEDELIVSLPIIPRHTEIDECGKVAQALQAFAPDDKPETMDPPLRYR